MIYATTRRICARDLPLIHGAEEGNEMKKIVWLCVLATAFINPAHASGFDIQLIESAELEGTKTGFKLGGHGEKWGGYLIFIPTDHNRDEVNRNTEGFHDTIESVGEQDVYVDSIWGFEVSRKVIPISGNKDNHLLIGGAVLLTDQCPRLATDQFGENCYSKGVRSGQRARSVSPDSETVFSLSVGYRYKHFIASWNSFYGISVGYAW